MVDWWCHWIEYRVTVISADRKSFEAVIRPLVTWILNPAGNGGKGHWLFNKLSLAGCGDPFLKRGRVYITHVEQLVCRWVENIYFFSFKTDARMLVAKHYHHAPTFYRYFAVLLFQVIRESVTRYLWPNTSCTSLRYFMGIFQSSDVHEVLDFGRRKAAFLSFHYTIKKRRRQIRNGVGILK